MNDGINRGILLPATESSFVRFPGDFVVCMWVRMLVATAQTSYVIFRNWKNGNNGIGLTAGNFTADQGSDNPASGAGTSNTTTDLKWTPASSVPGSTWPE